MYWQRSLWSVKTVLWGLVDVAVLDLHLCVLLKEMSPKCETTKKLLLQQGSEHVLFDLYEVIETVSDLENV